MDEPVKSGKSRQLQYKEWKRYFEWEKQTRNSYKIIEIFNPPKEKEDGRIHNGGSRSGAGADGKLVEEVSYILNCFLYDAMRKNNYYRLYGYENRVYFNSDTLAKYFGCYKDLYAAVGDELVQHKIFLRVSDKIREKMRSLVIEKIKKAEGIQWGYGIIIWRKENGVPEVRDDLLELWLESQQRYLETNKWKTEKDVIIAGKWDEMIRWITQEISREKNEVLCKAKKFYKVEFDSTQVEEYDRNQYKDCLKNINIKFARDIYQFFLKKEKAAARANANAKAEIKQIFSLLEEGGEKEKGNVNELIEKLEEPDSEEEIVFEFDEDKVMEPYRYILKNYILIG